MRAQRSSDSNYLKCCLPFVGCFIATEEIFKGIFLGILWCCAKTEIGIKSIKKMCRKRSRVSDDSIIIENFDSITLEELKEECKDERIII